MPKRDQAYMAARREEIVQAAIAIMMRSGFGAFTTTALCQEVGISMGALYSYFKTKHDILQAITSLRLKFLVDTYNFQNSIEMKNRLNGLLKSLISPESSSAVRMDLEYILQAPSDPALYDLSIYQHQQNALISSLSHLVRVGQLRSDVDPQRAAIVIESMIVGASVVKLARGVDHLFEAAVTEALERYLDSLIVRNREGSR